MNLVQNTSKSCGCAGCTVLAGVAQLSSTTRNANEQTTTMTTMQLTTTTRNARSKSCTSTSELANITKTDHQDINELCDMRLWYVVMFHLTLLSCCSPLPSPPMLVTSMLTVCLCTLRTTCLSSRSISCHSHLSFLADWQPTSRGCCFCRPTTSSPVDQ